MIFANFNRSFPVIFLHNLDMCKGMKLSDETSTYQCTTFSQDGQTLCKNLYYSNPYRSAVRAILHYG